MTTAIVKINNTLLIEILLIWIPNRPITTSLRNSYRFSPVLPM